MCFLQMQERSHWSTIAKTKSMNLMASCEEVRIGRMVSELQLDCVKYVEYANSSPSDIMFKHNQYSLVSSCHCVQC